MNVFDLSGRTPLVTGASSGVDRAQDLDGVLLLLASDAGAYLTGAY